MPSYISPKVPKCINHTLMNGRPGISATTPRFGLSSVLSTSRPCTDIGTDSVHSKAICWITEPTDWFIHHRTRPHTPVPFERTFNTRRQDKDESGWAQMKTRRTVSIQHIWQRFALTSCLLCLTMHNIQVRATNAPQLSEQSKTVSWFWNKTADSCGEQCSYGTLEEPVVRRSDLCGFKFMHVCDEDRAAPESINTVKNRYKDWNLPNVL